MNFNFGLYPVITSQFCNGRSPIFVLDEVIKAGVKIVQLREKEISKKELYYLALKFREITAKAGVFLVINDHADIAHAVKADAVHLGQDDLPCSAAHNAFPELCIGVSTHNEEEIEEAVRDGAGYINIGPLFQTGTKKLSMNPLGLEYLKRVKVSIPFSVMGGIKKEHIPELLSLGVKNIAMVTQITQADNIRKKTEELLQLFR